LPKLLRYYALQGYGLAAGGSIGPETKHFKPARKTLISIWGPDLKSLVPLTGQSWAYFSAQKFETWPVSFFLSALYSFSMLRTTQYSVMQFIIFWAI
jgi:hypothetical protein